MNVQNLSFPVTKIQEQLIWLTNKSHGGSLAYNIMQTLMLEGRLDRSLMRQVLLELTQRHESLRASVDTQNNVQYIHPDVTLDAKLVDISNVPEHQQDAEYRAWLATENCTLFSLEKAPLVRFRFVKFAEEKHVLVIVAHHIVCDGWSLGLLVQDIAQAYSLKYTGSYQSLPPAMQFSEYAALISENDAIKQRRIDNQAYWYEKYAQGAPVLNLPTDYSRPKDRTFKSFFIHRDISADTILSLRKLGGRCGSTLFMVFYSAFALTLHRYTQQQELLIGVPSSGRLEPNTDTIVGYLGALLPLLSQYDPEEDITTFIRRQKSTLLDGYQFEDYSFADLVESLPIERAENRSALVDVIFNLQPSVNLKNETNLNMSVGFEPSLHVAYDIFLNITDYQGHYSVDVDFNADVFSKEGAGQFVDSYIAVLDSCLKHLGAPIKRMPLLNQDNQQRLVQDWNASQLSCRDISLSRAIEACVATHPECTALVCENTRVSFARYNSQANQLARELQAQGIGFESRVGVCLARSEITYISFLAILKLGAAFVPLDPSYPQSRLQKIIQLAGVDLVLVDKQTDRVVAGLNTQNHYLDTLEGVSQHKADNLDLDISPDALAYLIYTSGSTGEPKGVAIRNKSVVAMLDAVRDLPHIRDNEVWLTVNSLSFDICILENFFPMVFGGTLVIGQRDWIFDPAHLHQVAKEENVTLCVATPSMWRLILSQPEVIQQRFNIISGGEALSHTQALELTQFADHVWNFYGPTEATVWASCHPVSAAALTDTSDTNLLVGKPLENYQFYIVDENLELVPPGVPGLLLIGGAGLARGYWNAPTITASSFIPDPFSDQPGARLYNTGDIARYQTDGSVEYISRADDQIKVRGFRIELGEIENAIRAFKGAGEAKVSNAVVIGVEDDADVSSHKLAAYVESQDADFSVTALLRHLKDTLPAYMVPSTIQQVSQIKLTESRKVDYAALPKPDFSFTHDEEVTPASTPAEKAMSQIWGAVLKLDTPDIHSSFFEMGGHSLMATQLVDYINRSGYFAQHIALADVFTYPNIAQMAQSVEASLDAEIALQFAGQPCLASENGAGANADMASESGIADGVSNPFFNLDLQGEFDFEIETHPEQRFEPFPLTELQQAYFIGRSSAVPLGNAESYNYSAVEIHATYAQRVERAWNTLIARHDMLRVEITEDARQRVQPEAEHYHVELEDLSELNLAQQQARLAEIKQTMTFFHEAHAQPDNFLLRLSKLSDDTYCLHMVLSMMVFDGASLRLIFDEFATLLAHPHTEFEPLTLSFRDCVLSECRIEQSEGFKKAQIYWKERVASMPSSPKLPLVKDIYAIKRPYLTRLAFEVEQAKWDVLKAKAVKNAITPSILAFTLLAELLGAWSNSRHFTVNLTLFNRLGKHPQLSRVVGDFTSTTLLEVNRQKQHSFVQAAQANQTQLLMDIQHRHYGGVKVLRDINLAQGEDSQVIMPIVFTSDLSIEFAGADSELASAFSEFPNGISLTPQVLLDFMVMEHKGNFRVNVDFLSEAFPEGMIPTLLEQYERLLNQLAQSDELWQQHTLDCCPAAQLQQREALNIHTEYDQEALLHTGFEQQALARPQAVAIINADGTQFTYAQINTAANILAAQLIAGADAENDLIGVLFEKGWQQTVATLAILKSGGAYLPLNADAPPRMLASIIEQSGANRLVTAAQWSELPELVATKVKTLHLNDEIFHQSEKGVAFPAFYRKQSPSSIAYVIYTSGSTGKPKGVALDHTGPVNTNNSINDMLNISVQDRVLALSALSFDLSVYDIFGVLAAGGAIVYPDAKKDRDPAHWHSLMTQHNVSLWNTVPALMQIYADYLGAEAQALTSNLRNVMMSGDWLPVTLPEQLRTLASIEDVNDTRLNLYSLGGATEASIWSIFYPIKSVEANWKSIPYGKPLPNQQYYVLDEALDPCPNHVIGDLYIGGVGVAQGYFKDDVKTQASFFIHPELNERLYRTGDTGCYLDDGNIEFFGRKDTQVKVQGYRVELGQIEHNINEHPDVKDCVVLAEGERGENKRLVAYMMRQSKQAQKAVEAKADQDGQAEVMGTSDAASKALFKLSRKGLRTDVNNAQSIEFAHCIEEAGLLSLAYQQSVSALSNRDIKANINPNVSANVSAETNPVVSPQRLFNLLASLCEISVEQAPLPKYFYPSSGSLNPVQTYVEVNQTLSGKTADTVEVHIEPGIYYLNSQTWSLHLVATQPHRKIAATSEQHTPPVRIHLIGVSDAITPLYDSHANMLCQVEAGYMEALLDGVAQAQGLLMRRQTCTDIETAEQRLGATWFTDMGLSEQDWLVSTLDIHAEIEANAEFDLGIFERQSYRRYDAKHFQLSHLETLLTQLKLDNNSLTLCVYLKQAHQGKHYFRFDSQTQALIALSTPEKSNLGQHTRGNQALEAQSDFSVFLVGRTTFLVGRTATGGRKSQFHLCGQIGQRLSALAPKLGLGLCPIGWVDDADLKAIANDASTLNLGADNQNVTDAAVLHSFIGGAIALTQTLTWGDVDDMKTAASANVVQTTDASSEQLTQQVKTHLERTLAPYMVPQIYRLIDKLPLTANGKVDRKRLPSLPYEEFTGKSFVAPSNAIQKQIAALWCDTLNIEKVGIDEHFFAVGGSSVTLIGMAALFKKEMDVTLDIIDLFNYPTVGQLAEFIGNQSQIKAQASEQFHKKQERAAKQRQRVASARRTSRGAKRGESS